MQVDIVNAAIRIPMHTPSTQEQIIKPTFVRKPNCWPRGSANASLFCRKMLAFNLGWCAETWQCVWGGGEFMLENPKGMKNEYGPIRDKYCATEGK